ncbi:MAG TPA: hypothetical protein VG476_06530, partial [Acidimicrobiales bacterium]|nr:hypothetical protein [Acidimicrobiales bacterium]
ASMVDGVRAAGRRRLLRPSDARSAPPSTALAAPASTPQAGVPSAAAPSGPSDGDDRPTEVGVGA